MSVYNGGLRAGLIAACAAMLLACVHLLAMHGTAVAQCPPVFADGEPGQGIKGTANCAINFDPDGAGPSPSLLIVGGRELELPGLLKCALLAYDGVRWSRLDTTSSLAGAGYFTINAMTVLNGELIVAGFFSSIAGVPATNIAAWNGTNGEHWGQVCRARAGHWECSRVRSMRGCRSCRLKHCCDGMGPRGRAQPLPASRASVA